ncbi:MAG: phosphotransferase [Rhodothermaceae bacterium]|nr:phosphotransferase [Rhodothermaceae bacterium]
MASVGGGCIAHATRIETATGRFFLKWNDGEAGRTFEAEADGLRVLRNAAPPELRVPEVLAVRNAAETPGFLLLEWLAPARPNQSDWERFGAALAALHRTEAPGEGRYGYAKDNWIGSKPQRNRWVADWPTFFGEQRLRAQAETVRQRGAWNAAWDRPLDRLIARLPDLLPASPPPSVLHGDLWGGNALATADGRFALVDPAVYVGHREADLAMTELFGGFDAAFYEAYPAAWPLEPGYAERREVYNLFHLINHLTHGPGYAGSVEGVLRRFG